MRKALCLENDTGAMQEQCAQLAYKNFQPFLRMACEGAANRY